MNLQGFTRFFSRRAPVVTGAVLYVALVFGAASCGKKHSTPDWSEAGLDLTAVASPPATAGKTDSIAGSALPGKDRRKPGSSGTIGSEPRLRFINYNLRNWLTMEREERGKPPTHAAKPKAEKRAAVSMLVRHRPDVIGVCEIGVRSDLVDLQSRLKAAGLDLPHLQHCGGSDSVRFLGLLSRFPIRSVGRPAITDFRIQGRTYSINRGVLDVSLVARGEPFRFLGVHLKSKREVPDVDQEIMRIHEAKLLRRHVDAILADDPQARLVVYGDFNDTRPSITVKTITGSYQDKGYLTVIPFLDSRGHAWTHHWAAHDIYSRIDFVAVSKALRQRTDFQRSYIIDDAEWCEASDHRPTMAVFR